MSEPRFPILKPEERTARQNEVAASIAEGPRGAIRGPFLALIHQPELADRLQRVGEHLRYGSVLPKAMTELAVLTVARRWSCQYEWFAHARIARTTTDLPEAIIVAISEGKIPTGMTDEQETVYHFVKETLANGAPADAIYDRAVEHYGHAGVLDLIGLTGYYSTIAMVLNTSRIPLPDGATPPLAPIVR